MCHINDLIDEAKCYEEVRRIRWPSGVCCPKCTSNKISKRGKNHRQQECRRYSCQNCGNRFDDLTETIFMGRHQPLSVWFSYLYLMGLNISNRQIAMELNLNESDGQAMANQLRDGIVKRRPKAHIKGKAECDEVYIVAGHKGQPDRIEGRAPRRRRLKGAPGRGTLEKDKPPIFGMLERGGEVRIIMLENVQQKTIRPLIEETIEPGTLIYTDEYVIYNALEEWGYEHASVCHGRGEYARDEDGDGFHEVHVNTIEGFWSLLRSWLRPHRGISQEKLPIYLGFFEFVHNTRRRGRALLGSLLDILLQPAPCPQNSI
ncbi:transposase [Gammaproteobacteria bacterium]